MIGCYEVILKVADDMGAFGMASRRIRIIAKSREEAMRNAAAQYQASQGEECIADRCRMIDS